VSVRTVAFDLWAVALMWFSGVALGVYASSAVSGGHINPAVTIGLATAQVPARGPRGTRLTRTPMAQQAGAGGADRRGKFFEKGQSMGTGQVNVKSYNRYLRDLIIAGRAEPSFVVSKELPLEEAPDAYQRFDNREEGYSKVVLHPNAAQADGEPHPAANAGRRSGLQPRPYAQTMSSTLSRGRPWSGPAAARGSGRRVARPVPGTRG